MSTLTLESEDSFQNPLDLMEEIVTANDWVFQRAGDDELMVQIAGNWCDYRLYFGWVREIEAMQFSCALDMKVPEAKKESVYTLLGLINETLWFGHFDLPSQIGLPTFRHAMLLRGVRGASVEQLEDLVDVTLSECERFYPAFQFVIWGGKSAPEAIEAAILETVGEA